MNMKMALLGVDNTERCDEVGDNHEGEEDEDEEVQVGGQQGKDEAPEMQTIDKLRKVKLNQIFPSYYSWL